MAWRKKSDRQFITWTLSFACSWCLLFIWIICNQVLHSRRAAIKWLYTVTTLRGLDTGLKELLTGGRIKLFRLARWLPGSEATGSAVAGTWEMYINKGGALCVQSSQLPVGKQCDRTYLFPGILLGCAVHATHASSKQLLHMYYVISLPWPRSGCGGK